MADIQLKYFAIPVAGDIAAEDALNRFLRGHHVLEVRQEFVADAANSVWSVAVRYAQMAETTSPRGRSERSSVDYKNELKPEAFARFVELRKRRLKIANAESLPAFAVFTDKELAAIAELEDPKPHDLQKIKGIGKMKADRFGARILEDSDEAYVEETKNETSRPTA